MTVGTRKDTCDDRGMPRPATGKTPVTNFRIPPHIVQAAKEKAAAEGRTLTDVIVAYLKRYAATPPRKQAEGD
jgi:hypothetical protein